MVKTKSYQRINGNDFKNLILNVSRYIRSFREELNDLNVFPVPDGDTGSNMTQTVEGGAMVLSSCDNENIGEVANLLAQGMLKSARGNSGVILSLLFRGIASSFKGLKECDGLAWAKALEDGAKEAYSAVESPADGTILTVAKKSAMASKVAANIKNDFEYVLCESINECERAVLETIKENPVLERAGVVDAGGAGFLVILKAMLQGLKGEIKDVDLPAYANASAFADVNITYTYCTEILVKKSSRGEETSFLKEYLKNMGDSLVFLDDGEIIKIHIHTNSPYDVIGRALAYGEFESVKVENMKTQHKEKITHQSKRTKKFGFVAVASGEGFVNLFYDLGADKVIAGGQTMNPSVKELLDGVQEVNADTVFLLPNNKNVIMSAKEVEKLSHKCVVVISTKSVPQGISAMLGFNESLTREENVREMTKMTGGVSTFYISRATKDKSYSHFEIKENELLAIEENEILLSDTKLENVLDKIGERIIKTEKSNVCIYYGQNVTEEEAKKTLEALARALKGNADINLYKGEQPIYHYVISAE